MNHLPQPQTKLWCVPTLDRLELFRANAIHHTYSRHFHPGYSIGVIEAGIGGNSYRGCNYLAPPGSIVFMNPEEVHTGYSAKDVPLTYRMLYPSIGLIEQFAQPASEFLYFKESVVNDQALARRICRLHAALERSLDRLESESQFTEVFNSILTRYAGLKPRSIATEHQAVHRIKQYLEDNFSRSISLDQLVEITHLNRSYLIRVFRQAVGMPPYTYLNQIRIEKAKQLLAKNCSIADVAIAVGMADQSHLTRHFKQIVGVTPGIYRQSTSFKTDSQDR